MNSNQIALVKNSWTQVTPKSEEAGQLFYHLLFEAAPAVKPLFKADIKEQSRKLMAMISMVVSRLDNLDTLKEDIRGLASRHNKYGAKPEHYKVVGQTLIRTLQLGLGEKWNNETQEAWLAAYSLLSETMMVQQQADLIKNRESLKSII